MRFKTFFLTHYFSIRLTLMTIALVFSSINLMSPTIASILLNLLFVVSLFISMVLEVVFDEQERASFDIVAEKIYQNQQIVKDLVQCDVCTHEWIAAYTADCEELECPKCHQMAKID